MFWEYKQFRALGAGFFGDVEDIGYYSEANIKPKKMGESDLAEFQEFEHSSVLDQNAMVQKFKHD